MYKKIFFIFPIFIVLYEMSTYLSNDMYLPALPLINQFFTINQSASLLSLTCWFIGSFSIQLFVGPLSDKYGRKPVLIFGALLFITANILAANTTNYLLFLLSRFMQGSSVCCVVVAGYAGIHEFFDNKKAIKTVALMNSLMILAPTFGPLLGAYIITKFHWEVIFNLLALLTTISLFGFLFFMPETNNHKTPKIGIKEIFLDYKNILKNKTFCSFSLTFCLVFAGLISWITASPLFIMVTLEKSPLYFGISQLVVFGGFVIGTRIASFYADNALISDKIIQRGLNLILAASVVCLLAVFEKNYMLWLYILGMTFYAFCTGMIFSPMQRKAVFAAGRKMGCNMAVFFTIMGLMCILGSIAINIFYKNTIFSMASVLAFFAILSSLVYFGFGKIIDDDTRGY